MKRWQIIVLALVALSAISAGTWWWQQRPVTGPVIEQAVPTLFFHGYGSSANAEEHMANAALKAKKADGKIRANVAPDGHVTLSGRLAASVRHPLVLVNFENSRQNDGPIVAQWVQNVLEKLQTTYHVTRFNAVGHSFGNTAVAYYLTLKAPKNEHLPRLHKMVAIAGPYAGIKGMNSPAGNTLDADGKPKVMVPTYRDLLALREVFPKAAVLNLYGDVGNGSDGPVETFSAQSLRYLVSPRASSYRELEFTGPKAQHSQLHDNAQVDKALIAFLWP